VLQDFQFPQSHERRVAFEQLGRVGLAAHGRRFLTARDQVRLGRLLASVTLFIRSFMSPGRTTSRAPTETISDLVAADLDSLKEQHATPHILLTLEAFLAGRVRSKMPLGGGTNVGHTAKCGVLLTRSRRASFGQPPSGLLNRGRDRELDEPALVAFCRRFAKAESAHCMALVGAASGGGACPGRLASRPA